MKDKNEPAPLTAEEVARQCHAEYAMKRRDWWLRAAALVEAQAAELSRLRTELSQLGVIYRMEIEAKGKANRERDAARALAARLAEVAEQARATLAMLTTRLCLTDPRDTVTVGGQGPPWTLWELAESLEDTIGPLDAALAEARAAGVVPGKEGGA